MTTRTKKLATLLTAGLVLSSGAYALGSQTGDGGALAASATGTSSSGTANGTAVGDRRGGPGRRGPGPGLDDLATKLGVTPGALRTALEAIRDEKTPAQRRTELAGALATALGKPVDQVTAAVDSVLPDKPSPDRARGDFAADLAKALGVPVAKVQAGLDKAKQDFRGRRGPRGNLDAVVGDIASATGVDAAKVRSALRSLRPGPGKRHEHRDDVRQKLATALGVTTDRLDAAFEKVRTQARDQFATDLAQKLNIDPQKVKDALPDFPGRGRRHG
jgi:hypothetical protein